MKHYSKHPAYQRFCLKVGTQLMSQRRIYGERCVKYYREAMSEGYRASINPAVYSVYGLPFTGKQYGKDYALFHTLSARDIEHWFGPFQSSLNRNRKTR